jgi:hypothetical protein
MTTYFHLRLKAKSQSSRKYLHNNIWLLCALVVAMSNCGYGFKIEYTQILVTYPGVIAHYRTYPNEPSREHVHNITITQFDASEWSAVIIGKDDSKLPISGLSTTSAEEWAKKQIAPDVERDNSNQVKRISVLGGVVMRFDKDGKLKSLFIPRSEGTGTRVVLKSHRGTVTWPCSRSELTKILGEPTKTEIEKRVENRP